MRYQALKQVGLIPPCIYHPQAATLLKPLDGFQKGFWNARLRKVIKEGAVEVGAEQTYGGMRQRVLKGVCHEVGAFELYVNPFTSSDKRGHRFAIRESVMAGPNHWSIDRACFPA